MAMAYGNVYVAQVAIGANDAPTVRALLEAESYPGPSLVLAYGTCTAHGLPTATGISHQKDLVDCGQWPLFRYDPRLAGTQRHPFQLDSRKPKRPFREVALQEARFAVLALSSAGGSAPFDAALSRYVEFLTADGALEVDLEIEPDVELAPDEQIEVFRIVQEGLANVRRHADARRAVVRIGMREGNRVVSIFDDGRGLDEDAESKGQGLPNMRTRATSIGGGFRLFTRPGGGTAVEVTLRA
jgi:hypothetical protein